MKKIKLITGIPRSGTTLCCHILNQQQDTVALHEPINPSIYKNTPLPSLINSVNQHISELQQSIIAGKPFEHGNSASLLIDNPVSDKMIDGRRVTGAQRGELQLAPMQSNKLQLVIKQNAFFAALIKELKIYYEVVCIVRNPVDVLMSWWSVNLPVSKGRVPAAENISKDLVSSLRGRSELHRQFVIYEWFVRQYSQSGCQVITYEDIIRTNGDVLSKALNIQMTTTLSLNAMNRSYNKVLLHKLSSNSTQIAQLNFSNFYTVDDIKYRIDSLINT